MPSVALPLRTAPRARSLAPLAACFVGMGVVVLWAVWAAVFNTAQFGDNVEQFNWAQSLELGYHKHPPLPSWVLAGVIKLWGPSIYWAYVLATLCLLGTGAFTFAIARELVGERVAAAAILLWGLNMTFSRRLQLYNHNTVLVLWFAATVWASMRASRGGRLAAPWWIATGLAAAAATLSKYQALVPLAGLVLALGASGRLDRRGQRAGLMLAIVTLLATCLPHAVWVARHDFSTLRYASEAIESSGPRERLSFILAFAANQLRLWSPALLAMALAAAWGRVRPSTAPAAPPQETSAEWPAWAAGLIWAGLVVLVIMALGGGVSLRNHWGVQALQFFGIWLAWRWDRRQAIDLTRLVCVALAIHACSLAWYAVEHRDPRGLVSKRRIDTMYPARRLARAAVTHWSETTQCPLRYVAGTVFDAGLVALYSGGSLKVFDTAAATPWIRPDELHEAGALYVLDQDDAVPAGVTDLVEFDLVPPNPHGRRGRTVRLGVMRPVQPCD